MWQSKKRLKRFSWFLLFFCILFVLGLVIIPLIARAEVQPEITSIQLNSLMSEFITQKAEFAIALKKLETSEWNSKQLIEQLANYKLKEANWQSSFNQLQQQVESSTVRSQELENQLSEVNKAMNDVSQLYAQFKTQAEAEIKRLKAEVRKQKIEKWVATALAAYFYSQNK